MVILIQKRIILYLCCGAMIFMGFTVNAIAVKSETSAKRQPLRVVIRPIERDKKQDSPNLHLFNENGLIFKEGDMLNDRFYSGYEDVESLKRFGYSINSEIGSKLRMKMRATDDPDDLLHLNDYKNKQLYSGATVAVLNPLLEIQQGCQSKMPKGCSFTRYGQYWLKTNLRTIDISRSRADDFLVNLIKTLD